MKAVNSDTVEIKIKEILGEVVSARLDIEGDDIDRSTLLRDELGIDSFEGLLILAAIEQKFNITIDISNISHIKTFGDMLHMAGKYINKEKKR